MTANAITTPRLILLTRPQPMCCATCANLATEKQECTLLPDPIPIPSPAASFVCRFFTRDHLRVDRIELYATLGTY